MRADISKYLKLIDYEKALELAISATPNTNSEVVKTELALGRVSDENIASDIDIPESDIAMMDGYAVKSQNSGSKSDTSKGLYITTGSLMPEGYDAVARVEDTRFSGDSIIIARPIQKFRNVLRKGEDIKKGSIIVKKGDIINPAHISLLVYLGIRRVKVKRKYTVGIVSVGRELRKAGDRNARKKVNNYAYLICNYIKYANAEPKMLGVVNDQRDEIISLVENAIKDNDMLITIGRSSIGSNDRLLQDLTSFSGEVVFHGVKLLPARPAGLIRLKGKPVWMLPAHAVSSVISLFTLVIPALSASSTGSPSVFNFTIPSIMKSQLENSRFLPSAYMLKLERSRDRMFAYPLRWGSNFISSLLNANAYLVVPPRHVIREGEQINAVLLGPFELFRIAGD